MKTLISELKGNKYDIGVIIKKLRQSNKMTQVQLSASSEVSNSYISRLESGEEINISINKLYKLSRTLDIEIDEIMKLVDFKNNID